VIFWLVALPLIAMVEKRLVWPYVREGEAPPDILPARNDYGNAVAAAMAGLEFRQIGTFADGKGKLYRIRYEFYRSPTGDVIAMVGTGTIASIPLQATWLYTLMNNDRVYVTVDHQNAVTTDLTGMVNESLVAGVGLVALLSAHRVRFAQSSGMVKSFSNTDPLGEFKVYLEDRVRRLHALGYVTFLNPDRTGWRYSVKGALAISTRQYLTGLRRAVVPDKVRSA